MKHLTHYQRNGFKFSIAERWGNVARFVGIGTIGGTTHEVIVVQSHDGREIHGKHYPPAEFPPSNEQWGSKGWTYPSEDAAKFAFAAQSLNLDS